MKYEFSEICMFFLCMFYTEHQQGGRRVGGRRGGGAGGGSKIFFDTQNNKLTYHKCKYMYNCC